MRISRHRQRSMLVTAMLVLTGLAACSQDSTTGPPATVQQHTEVPLLAQDPHRYTRGLHLYQQHCAGCHGRQGQGAVNWKQRDSDGRYRPPPLNGSGHTWHHPLPILLDIINNGTARLGGNMPAWHAILNEQQVLDILFWLQSQWPREIYELWYRNNSEYLRNARTNSQ